MRRLRPPDRGRATGVEDPQNSNALTNPRYEYGYDALGNYVSITDPLGRVTRFEYDAQGRQTQRTLSIGVSTTGDATDFIEQGWKRGHS